MKTAVEIINEWLEYDLTDYVNQYCYKPYNEVTINDVIKDVLIDILQEISKENL